jgi:hypothetical protein
MKPSKIMKNNAKKALVVTTDKRGVFFGYAEPTEATTIRLEDAQMCVFWDTATKGVMGLAATGPTKGCRIGPAVPAITLQGVTSVMEATAAAEAAWKSKPWA